MGCLLSKFQHKWTPTPTTTQQQDESEAISTNPKKVCAIEKKYSLHIRPGYIVLCRSRVYILLYKNRMKYYTSEKKMHVND